MTISFKPVGSRRSWFRLASLILFWAGGLAAPLAEASSTGITGRTNRDGGAGCSAACHSGTTAGTVAVSISGPSTLAANQVGFYTVTSNYSVSTLNLNAGVNIASGDGVLTPSGNLTNSGNTELYHSTPNKTNSFGDTVFSFSWTMPAAAVGSGHTLYATSRVSYSGNWAHAPNFGVTTAAAFTAFLDGVAVPGGWTFGQTGTLSFSGGETTGGVSFSSSNTAVCSVSGTTLSAVGVGSCVITATKPQTSTSSALSDTFSLSVSKAPQTITFPAVAPKLTNAAPFNVSATGGGSGLPVTFTTSGVCTNSGATITLTGAAGTCTVTAAQAGNGNYLDAAPVSINIGVVAAGEVFPPNCAAPAGWAQDPTFPSFNWSVATDSASQGACSFKPDPLPGAAGFQFALYSYTGNFQAGTISFSVRVSSFTGTACFLFAIDQVYQGIGSSCTIGVPGLSGELPYQTINIPVTEGAHKIWILYYRNDNMSIAGSDTAWLDQFTMPLLTAITSPLTASVTIGTPFSYQVVADNFPQVYAATSLPPGLSINSSTGLISGTPTLAGTFPVTLVVSNPGGVAPSATDTKTLTITVDKVVQTISFGAINNRLTTAPAFSASATGGASGNPVTFSASGVCTAGGPNGSTITLTGAAGTCSVTADQAGDATYAAATSVAQSFTVSLASSEVFPPNCAMPAGWTAGGATYTWSAAANDSSTAGACSLRTNVVPSAGVPLQADIQFAGTFAAGNVSFKYRVSSENQWDCFQFSIDGVAQNVGGTCNNVGLTGNSGESGWVSVSVPISAGAHTLRWRYDKDDTCCASGSDAVWLDEVVFPQFTLTIAKAGAGIGTVFSEPSGIVCGGSCSATLSGNVALTAFPNPGSYLASWSGGGCSGNAACLVPLTASTTVTANFALIVAPTAPQSVASTAGNGQATITFSPPANNGGAAITLYTSTCTAPGQTTRTDNAGGSPIVATGLANGVQYSCTVAATNSAGIGAASAATLVTPRTVPDAPVIGGATPGNAQASVAFTAPVFNGGATITTYTATCTSATQPTRTASGAASPLTVGSLVNGTAYSCSVTATNVAGTGVASAPVSVTPRTVPGAPNLLSSSFLDGRVSVNFTPPAGDGGSAITGYTLACNPGALSQSGTSSPISLTGLTNGISYTCTLSANNAAGSAPTAPFTGTPAINTGDIIYGGVCSACHSVPPDMPQYNAAGTTANVLNYVISNVPTMGANPAVTGLTAAERINIAVYLKSLIATTPEVTPFNVAKSIDVINQISVGSVSFESLEVVTPPAHGTLSAFTGTSITYTPTTNYTGPDSFTFRGKRTAPTALNGDTRTMNITVSPPPVPVISSSLMASGTNGIAFSYQIQASNAPTGYTATGLPSGLSFSAATGLISGTPTVGGSFNVTISASNQGGAGPSSTLAISLSPTGQTITFPAQTTLTRPFSPSPSNTFAISPTATASSSLPVSYVSKTGGICSVAGTTVTMLAAGTCTIGANQGGNASFTVATEVTRSVTITAIAPGAPVIGAGTPGNNQATIAFGAPANTGGTTITLYTATCTPTGTGTNAVGPIVVSGLTNGTTYSCSVTATNSAGTGPASASVSVTPAPTPTPPLITSATSTTFTVNAPGSFAVTATGTPAVSGYTVTGTLPTGVTFGTTTGVLSGTPTQAGSFPLNFTAANGVLPNAAQSFTLTVNKANQTISFTNPGTQAFSPTAVPLSAVSTASLAVTFVSDTTGVCTISGSNAVLVAVGTCTIRAQQAGNGNFNAATDVAQSFSVVQGTQVITFGAQVPPSRAYVGGNTFALSPTASASSGLGVSYSSLTLAVCSISGSNVTMVRAGTCTIAANQSGNANVSPATQVTQSIVFTGAVPGAPTLTAATPGGGKITLTFTAPASDGGSSIITYTGTCGAVTGTASSSPLVVSGLVNGTPYTCSVTATNATGTGAASNTLSATPAATAGAAVWAASCGLGGCHGSPPNPTSDPAGTRLNVGGNSTAVLDYVIPRQPVMNAIVGPMSPADRLAVANYIADFIPAVNASTPLNTPVGINVGSQVFMGTAISAFTGLQVVTPPANGALSAFTGTNVTYTPNNGFTGTDTFTYRATQAAVNSEPRTVSVTVLPAAPAITSALNASGTVGVAFSYQIAATNAPTSYGATGLPANLTINTATGQISGTPAAGGSTMVTISATSGAQTGSATLTINIGLVAQTITFGAQASPVVFASGGTFAINPVATGGASGNPIVYSSTTAGVCSVSGSTVTMLSAGVCTIAANQAGNATYAAAAQVTRNVSITGVAPAAPAIGTATAGNTQATIGFTPPANTGGLPITGYTVSCNGGTVTASGASAPIVVSGLTNGTLYTCSVQASNLAGSSPASATVTVTPVAIAFTGTVQSRKLHGLAGLFVVPINPATPIGGAIAIEPRSIGSGHQVAFTFNNPPTSLTALTVLDAGGQPVGSASPSFAGNDLVITLTGVPDGKRVTITATGVNGAINVSASVGFLLGDVNGSGTVTATDIAAIKSRSTQSTTLTNFRADLNTSGAISSADVSTVKAQAGKRLP